MAHSNNLRTNCVSFQICSNFLEKVTALDSIELKSVIHQSSLNYTGPGPQDKRFLWCFELPGPAGRVSGHRRGSSAANAS